MKVIDEKLARLKVNQEPLRLQIASAGDNRVGTCLCGEPLIGFYGLLCCGGYSLSDALIIFYRVCKSCVEGGQGKFAETLEQLGISWKKAAERAFLLSESIEKIPSEDWPVIGSTDQEGGGKVM